MYFVHCYVTVFSFYYERRVGSARLPTLKKPVRINRFFHRRIPNGFPDAHPPKGLIHRRSKELGWQAAIHMATTPDALLRTREKMEAITRLQSLSPVIG